MSNIFDSHCHLVDIDSNELSVITEQLSNLSLLSVSKSIDDWDKTLELGRLFPNILPAIGIHPWFINESSVENHLGSLKSTIALTNSLSMIGEIGLDFDSKYIHSKEIQIHVFEYQVEVALRCGLGISIHCRKAFDEVRSVLGSHNVSRAIMHGFSGSYEQAKPFIGLGCKLGIGTQLLNKQSTKYERLVRQSPIESLVLETDAPYGKHGQNLSHYDRLMVIAKRIATIKQLDVAEVVDMTYASAKSIIRCE
ncbi:TatD family hydrolase [Hydrogenovibrio kuenenii]|uniref:TatD family hydrolase n=1 Tax=Hydrogenovibrio kuenenii TaxID=63658 RepID=UPI000465B73C|nr:TatD family hydrolase [Hydrogenovibrio kuenenii]